MDRDMQEDLEKYKDELEKIRKEIVPTKMNNGDIAELRQRLFDTRMKIAILESEIEKINGNEGKMK